MECSEVRKKLKDYVLNKIQNPDILLEMEKHIQNCNICKRELLLWQDVLEKQEKLKKMQVVINGDLKDRIKKRMKNLNNNAFTPPILRRLNALSQLWNSKKGRLLIEIILVLIGFLWLFSTIHKNVSIFVPIFIIIGFGSLFLLLLKKK